MQDFRKLQVWNKAHVLTLEIYKVTAHFPKEELFGLTSQLRRASASIGSNLAEGCGRGSNADLGRFIQIAFGSASEVQYQLLLARDLLYLSSPEWEQKDESIGEIKRMLASLLKKLKISD